MEWRSVSGRTAIVTHLPALTARQIELNDQGPLEQFALELFLLGIESGIGMGEQRLSCSELLKLKRWNTPSIYNGWEAITKQDITRGFNMEETRDYMPQMGTIIGYAVTELIEPGNASHPKDNPNAWSEYRHYVAGLPGPKIVVVQSSRHSRTKSMLRKARRFPTKPRICC